MNPDTTAVVAALAFLVITWVAAGFWPKKRFAFQLVNWHRCGTRLTLVLVNNEKVRFRVVGPFAWRYYPSGEHVPGWMTEALDRLCWRIDSKLEDEKELGNTRRPSNLTMAMRDLLELYPWGFRAGSKLYQAIQRVSQERGLTQDESRYLNHVCAASIALAKRQETKTNETTD